MWFLALGSRLFNIFGGIGHDIGNFINSLLSIIQNIISIVFGFYQRLWQNMYSDPYKFITFLANIWVLFS